MMSFLCCKLLFFLAIPAFYDSVRAQEMPIAAIVAGDPNFSTLLTAIGFVPGLADVLSDSGTFTIFAPPNDAFGSLPSEFLEKITGDPVAWVKHIENLLLFHAAGATLFAADLNDGQTLSMLNGDDLSVSLADGVSLSSQSGAAATVVQVDINASNGVVHVIDAVLEPDYIFQTVPAVVQNEENLSTLFSLVVQEGLGDALASQDLTVLAPTNAAFADALADPAIAAALEADPELLTQVLLYHVIPVVVPSISVTQGDVTTLNGASVSVSVDGEAVRFNDATATAVDVLAFNGVIHTIDKVLIPPLGGGGDGGSGVCQEWCVDGVCY